MVFATAPPAEPILSVGHVLSRFHDLEERLDLSSERGAQSLALNAQDFSGSWKSNNQTWGRDHVRQNPQRAPGNLITSAARHGGLYRKTVSGEPKTLANGPPAICQRSRPRCPGSSGCCLARTSRRSWRRGRSGSKGITSRSRRRLFRPPGAGNAAEEDQDARRRNIDSCVGCKGVDRLAGRWEYRGTRGRCRLIDDGYFHAGLGGRQEEAVVRGCDRRDEAVHGRQRCRGALTTACTGAKSGISRRAHNLRRQPYNWLGWTPASRARTDTTAPGSNDAATSHSFSTSVHRRRR